MMTTCVAIAGQQMRVSADSVNMRARPSLKVEVVKPQLNAGDILEVIKIEGDWAEIVPPNTVDFYVHSAFVNDHVVQVSKLLVRSGPTVNYKDVGMLKKDDKVMIRGHLGEWLKIAPPPGSVLWVSTEFLKDPNARKEDVPKKAEPKKIAHEKPAGGERAASAIKRTPPKPVKRTPPKPVIRSVKHTGSQKLIKTAWKEPAVVEQEEKCVPPDLNLIPLKGQGKEQEAEGILRKKGFRIFSRAPAKYRLVVERGNGFATVCYIKGNEEQLDAFKGDKIKIKGYAYWVRGEDVPVIIPSKIMPLRTKTIDF